MVVLGTVQYCNRTPLTSHIPRTIHCLHMLLQLKHSSPHFVSDYKSDMDENQSCKSGLKTEAVLGRFHLQGNRKGQLSEKQGQSSGTILSKKT